MGHSEKRKKTIFLRFFAALCLVVFTSLSLITLPSFASAGKSTATSQTSFSQNAENGDRGVSANGSQGSTNQEDALQNSVQNGGQNSGQKETQSSGQDAKQQAESSGTGVPESGSSEGSADNAVVASNDEGQIESRAGEHQTTQSFNLVFYACINDDWKLVSNSGEVFDGSEDEYLARGYGITYDKDTCWDGGLGRYYVTGDKLETVYKKFGFTVSDIRDGFVAPSAGERHKGHILFAQTIGKAGSRNTLWADVYPWFDGSKTEPINYNVPEEWQIPLRPDNWDNRNQNVLIYYIPANVHEAGSSQKGATINDSTSVSNADVLQANTFYSVSVSDPAHAVYASDEEIPSSVYAFKGGSTSITVKQRTDGKDWKVFYSDKDDTVPYTKTDNGDGTLTYTFENLTAPIEISTSSSSAKEYTISYNAATLQNYLRYIIEPDAQKYDENGTITVDSSSGKQQLPSTKESLWVQNGELFDNNKSYLVPTNTELDTRLETKGGQPSNNRHFVYVFKGWKVANGTHAGEIINPYNEDGTIRSITKEELINYATAKSLSLEAVWSCEDAKSRITTANFYVCLNSYIEEDIDKQKSSNYTNSVFWTPLSGTDSLEQADPANNYVLVDVPKGSNTTYEVDRKIREASETSGADEAVALDGSVTIGHVPSDEEILKTLRENLEANPNSAKCQIRLDGKLVPAEDLTTDNFEVRWYNVKYERSDGWHVDAILIPRESKMVVTKTFLGDGAVIDQAKKNFAIMVTPNDESGQSDSFRLVLSEAEEASGKENEVGYTSFDEKTNTYTWIVSGEVGKNYTFEEKGNEIENVSPLPDAGDSSWTSSAWVKISNEEGVESKWTPYSAGEGETLTARKYASDLPISQCQTVSFENLYALKGTLSLEKQDLTSQDGLANVSFRLYSEDAKSGVELYRKPGTSLYSCDSKVAGYSERVGVTSGSDGNTYTLVTTDEEGRLYAQLPVGTYLLEEEFPSGYEGAKTIRVTVSEDKQNNKIEVTRGSEDSAPDGGWTESFWDSASDAGFLIAKNRSAILMTVSAKVKWDEADADLLKNNATIELWCNGKKLSDTSDVTYMVDLRGGSDYWVYTWENLPLFIDGEVANYSLSENLINGEDNSVEAKYSVKQGSPLYINTDSDPTKPASDIEDAFARANAGNNPSWTDGTGKTVFANHMLLTVTNGRAKGAISFTTVSDETSDNGEKLFLPGAKYAIYSSYEDALSEDASKIVCRAESDASGKVVFKNSDGSQLFFAGRYYFRETEAPAGYQRDDAVYRAKVYDESVQNNETWKGATDIINAADSGKGQITQIINKKLYVLPTTGGPGIVWFVLIGVGLMSAAAVGYLKTRKE